MKNALIIFTKEPIPGFTKTRLMPHLSGEECARFHKKFLITLRDNLVAKKLYDSYVCFASKGKKSTLQNIFKESVSYFPQEGENLGERMLNAFLFLFNKGYEKIILIGSDVPQINSEDIEKGLLALDEKDIVIGPTEDGGYYLVGMSKPQRIFNIGAYSHDKVFEDTLKLIEKKKLTYALANEYYDIDTIEDLRRYKREYKSKISIIVPVFNEKKIITKTMESVGRFSNRCEILFVDGGSTDGTPMIIKEKFPVFGSKKGRGNQLNEGAKRATGDILLFLHADCMLPDNAIDKISEVMADKEAGYFGIKYDRQDGIIMNLGAKMSNLRAQTGIVFGDQGMFIDTDLFNELGGFKDIPIMEDYEFSKRMKRHGIKLGCTSERITADSRRFTKNPFLQIWIGLKMYYLRFLYNIGVDVRKIAEIYK